MTAAARTLTLLGLLALPGVASARALTARDAVRLALENDHSVAAAEAGVDKARADERKALFAMCPKVSAMWMYRFQDPLPEIEWDLSSMYGGSGSGSTCDDITEDDLPDGWTLDMAVQMCELITGWMTPASTEPTVVTIGVRDNYTAQFAVDQVIFAGNALRQAHRATKDLLSASRDQLRQARAQAAYAAEQAFFGLYLAREAVRVTEQAQVTTDAYVADLARMVEVGIASRADLLSAQAQASRTRLEAMKAAHMTRVAEAAFRASLGIPPDEPVELVLTDAPLSADLPAGRDALVDLALQRRPELRALDASVSAMGRYSRAAWATWVPTVAFNATYSGQNPNPYASMLSFSGETEPEWFWSTNLSLVASWTLWDQGAGLYGHRSAAAARAQLHHQRRLLADMLPVEVESALSSWREAESALEVARVGLAQAEEAHRMEQDRFKAGVSNNTQLLAAQSALSGARLALLQAEFTLRTSQAALRKAVGEDPEVTP